MLYVWFTLHERKMLSDGILSGFTCNNVGNLVIQRQHAGFITQSFVSFAKKLPAPPAGEAAAAPGSMVGADVFQALQQAFQIGKILGAGFGVYLHCIKAAESSVDVGFV